MAAIRNRERRPVNIQKSGKRLGEDPKPQLGTFRVILFLYHASNAFVLCFKEATVRNFNKVRRRWME